MIMQPITNLAVLLLILVSSVASADDVQTTNLLREAKSEKSATRGAAVLKLGDSLRSITDDAQRKNVCVALIDAIRDRSELVSHLARLRIAENPKLINQYLGPYIKSHDFQQFGTGTETIKAVGSEARRWLPDLLKQLDSENKKFKLGALHAMRALDSQDLVGCLDQTIAALDHPDFNVQLSACRVLEKVGPDAKKAGPRLVRLMREGLVSSRSWASIALGAIGPHEDYDVTGLLEGQLDQFSVIDRERALIGLAHLGGHARSVLPKIEILMEKKSKRVQNTASFAHWKISGDPTKAVSRLTSLIATMEHGAKSMDFLAEIGPGAKSSVDEIIGQLKSTEFTHRESAVRALSSFGPAAGANAKVALQELLKNEEDLLIRIITQSAINTVQGN